jgi:hypothetical protein
MVSSVWSNSKVLDYASWIYWGYGVKPYNAVVNIAIIILLFGRLYFGLVRSKHAQVAKRQSKNESQSKDHQSISLLEALSFSARVLLLRPPEDVQIEGSYARFVIWAQRAIFGFFVLLFIAFFNEEVQSYFKPPT